MEEEMNGRNGESLVLPNSVKHCPMKLVLYDCVYCWKMCFSKEEVEQHEKTHTENKEVQCHLCNKGFARRSYLPKHTMAIHKGIQAFECSFCKKKFSFWCSLVCHIRIHTGERPFECHVCNMKFSHKKSMEDHERTHTGEKPFLCPECNVGFARRSSLVCHARIHANDRSFECHNCGKTFLLKSYLRRHVLTHMRPSPQERQYHRRTKAVIARDKMLKALSLANTTLQVYPTVYPNIVNIKVEENEDTMTRVFLPYLSPMETNYEEELE